MDNITITNKGNYYESCCGAWSVDGVSWFRDTGIAAHYPDYSLRTAFKQQILDGEPAPKPEPEVFTGDPIENEWGNGVFRDDEKGVTLSVSGPSWCAISNMGSVWGVGDDGCRFSRKFTRVSTNPTDLIAERWKGVE